MYVTTMVIGILSDTHGQVRRVRRALQHLTSAGAEVFFHCGDVGSPAVLDELAGRRGYVVAGNMDEHPQQLAARAAQRGLTFLGRCGRVCLDGRNIYVLHGDRQADLEAALADESIDIILYGHTHRAADRIIGNKRLINPGALFSAAVRSVATLELSTGQLQFHYL